MDKKRESISVAAIRRQILEFNEYRAALQRH